MSVLDANMTAFQTGYYLLITMSLLILAGNTCYPIFLRLIVWTMLKIVERLDGEIWAERAATLRFLLDHPRHQENVVVLADEAQCFVRVVGRDLGVIER